MLNEADSMQPSTSITQGIPASLACTATGRPAPTTKWEINSNSNATISNKAVGSPLITFKSVLTIQNPTKAMQNQQIICFVKHPFTSTMNKTTTLNIHCMNFSCVKYRPWIALFSLSYILNKLLSPLKKLLSVLY